MQGVQVCRYSPDFLHLDKDVRYHDFESIPDKERLMIRKGEKYIPCLLYTSTLNKGVHTQYRQRGNVNRRAL